MQIRLKWRRYELPFRMVVRTAHGPWVRREGLLLRLEDESGRVGFGEVAPVPGFGVGTPKQAEGELRSCGNAFGLGEWRRRGDLGGCVKFALATAEAMLEAGGAPAEAEKGDAWPLAALLPAGREALVVLDDQIEAGYRTFKWKVGIEDGADERALLDEVVARLPSGARLRLDANGAWNRREADRWLEHCAERPVEFVEQPVAADARGADDLLLGLARDFPTPLALDESLVGTADLRRWREAGWPGIWVVKLALLGDPDETLAELRAAGADVVFSSALETAVGGVEALRWAFRWEGRRRALGFGVWPLFADFRFDGPARAPFIRSSDLPERAAELWEGLI